MSAAVNNVVNADITVQDCEGTDSNHTALCLLQGCIDPIDQQLSVYELGTVVLQ